MWMWASPKRLAGGKATMLPAPNDPKRSAARVPGAIAPKFRTWYQPRWTTSLATRRPHHRQPPSAMGRQRTVPEGGRGPPHPFGVVTGCHLGSTGLLGGLPTPNAVEGVVEPDRTADPEPMGTTHAS